MRPFLQGCTYHTTLVLDLVIHLKHQTKHTNPIFGILNLPSGDVPTLLPCGFSSVELDLPILDLA